MRSFIVLAFVVACSKSARTNVDATQADAMLALLKAPAPAQVDAVMAAPGTALIVAQQNLSRRVTAEQYRTVLSAIAMERAPAIAPVDDSERAKRGVTGLVDDVWPALHWGTAQTGLLAKRLALIRALDVGGGSMQRARAWLPEVTIPEVRLHIVMGGRAGAAAIDRDIYFDVLAMSYRESRGVAKFEPSEITEFFAHETHHVGLGVLTKQQRATLTLDETSGRAYDLLAMLVAEGSATYFINAKQDLAKLASDPQYASHLANRRQLIATYEEILHGVLGKTLSGDAYEAALTPLVGSGFHSAGAVMFDAIYRADGRGRVEGLAAVLDVMRDPRQLFVVYNRAKPDRPVDAKLAAHLARLGDVSAAPARYE